MGRRKITIQQITDPKLRNITYNKRKNGLIKKAAEISLLCGINLMLVFEDLNGTLVQFSRNKIKSIGSFPKECTYKRVLELTAEDYPNFSPIKRHKKNQENVEEKKFQVPKLNGKHGARCADEMISEHESPMTKEEEVFSTSNDAMSGYTTGLNMVTESPETNFSEDYQAVYPRESNQFQPEKLKKAIKTTATGHVNIPVKSPNPKELKNRPKLRLNIPKTDDNNKDTMKVDSVGKIGSANSKKQLSSQKTYTRKPTFDMTSKPLNLMSPFPFLGLDAQNHQLNIRLANLINSPYKEAVSQRKAATFVNFPGEEDNNGPNFTDYSPFTFQAIGATPPIMKQGKMGEDHFSTDKIVNYLSHPGRSPPQQQTGVFTFQQAEVYNGPSYDHNNICGLETELASTRKNNNPFWDFPYNGKESCGKMDNGLPSAGLSGYKFNFDGYSFGNDGGIKDWGEAIRRMKMV